MLTILEFPLFMRAEVKTKQITYIEPKFGRAVQGK